MARCIDCNLCPYLNISESKQEELKANGKIVSHICLKFHRRVFHDVRTKKHDPYIYPCSECVAEMDGKDGESNG